MKVSYYYVILSIGMNVSLYAFNFKKKLNWNRIITFEVDKEKSHAIIKNNHSKCCSIPNR